MDPKEAIEKLKLWHQTCHDTLGPPKDRNVGRRRHLMQSYEELTDFCAVIEGMTPRTTCLEIGMYRGGTHYLWRNYFARVISLEVSEEFCNEARQVLDACGVHPEGSIIVHADAHSETGIQEVDSVLEGGQLDMLFLDGDHQYESAKADFESHHGRVREGGIIAFHDAGSPQHMPGVWQAVSEIEQNREQYGLGEKNLIFYDYAGIAWFRKETP